MDLRQLAALTAVADTGSFSAAARRLHTVQSNVSTHVARLEGELGAVLVDRGSGTLTEEGNVVALRARRIQHELESLRSDVESMLHEVSGLVRLGCIGTVSRWLVPPLLQAMEEHHPQVQVVVVDATTTSLVPQVVAETLDLAVVNLPLGEHELDAEPLFDEDRIILAPEGHPLAAYEAVELSILAEHALLLEPRGTAFRDELDEAAARAGVDLEVRAEVDGIRLLTSLAFQGFGPAMVPATAPPAEVEGSCRRVAVNGLSPRSVGLAWSRRGRLSAAARLVRDVVRQLAAGIDQPGVHPRPAT
ncbi:MAG TPA: LysR family transcriptional regulator [Acidimicrobiales bacterium]|nr:LysR family transcriptional regulator [Acidimicrobiales bacterium]